MSSVMAGTRLAAVANQRRQQRKQQKNAAAENTPVDKVVNNTYSQQKLGLRQVPTVSTFDDSTVSTHGSFFAYSIDTDRESKKENGGKKQSGLTCTTTESTSFDESTISSGGGWPEQKSNRGRFTALPKSVLSPSKKNHANISSTTNANSRRLRNFKLSEGTKPSSDSPKIMTATPQSLVGRTSPVVKHVAQREINTNDVCKTPKYNNLTNAKVASKHESSVASTVVTTATTTTTDQDQIRRLTNERERLQSDVAQLKRKLQYAIESNNKSMSEKDAIVSDLKNKIESLSVELEQKDGEVLMATVKAREMEKVVAEDDERMRSLHRKEMKALQSQLDKTEEELVRTRNLNQELLSEKQSLESKGNELCKVLQEVEEERCNMKTRVARYSEQLSQVQMECEQKLARHVQNQGQLEKSLQIVQNEKRSLLAESKQQISLLEDQLSKALSDKRDAEQQSQSQVSDLQNELQMQRNLHENFFSHQSNIVEALKSDLAKSIDQRKEAVRMKQEYEAIKSQNTKEVETLRLQLRSIQSEADIKVQTAEKEKEVLFQQLAQAVKDIDSLKLNRRKDVRFLESELDQTTKDKVEMEQELMETKRQLQNALRKLDALDLDGMNTTGLQCKVDDLTKEKNHYLKEIGDWKKVSEEHRCQIKDLKMDNEKYELECSNLRKQVASLEATVDDDRKYKVQEGLICEVEHLKEKLQLAKEEALKATAVVVNDESNAKLMQLENEKLELYSQITMQKQSMEELIATNRELTMELSRAQQRIQVQKSKETYLESRLDSLANQISKTVLAYEMKLSSSVRTEK